MCQKLQLTHTTNFSLYALQALFEHTQEPLVVECARHYHVTSLVQVGDY